MGQLLLRGWVCEDGSRHRRDDDDTTIGDDQRDLHHARLQCKTTHVGKGLYEIHSCR